MFILYGIVDVGVLVGGLYVFDILGIEILECVNLFFGIKMVFVFGFERWFCYCWCDVVWKVLVNGGNLCNIMIICVEVEGEEYCCEGI